MSTSESKLIGYILNEVINTPVHVARLFERMYFNKYRANVSSKKTVWEECNEDGQWSPIVRDYELRKRITEDVVILVGKAKSILKRRGVEATDEREVEFALVHFKELHKLKGNLYKDSFQTGIIKHCEVLMHIK
jgi:hypothetical protein